MNELTEDNLNLKIDCNISPTEQNTIESKLYDLYLLAPSESRIELNLSHISDYFCQIDCVFFEGTFHSEYHHSEVIESVMFAIKEIEQKISTWKKSRKL